MSIIAVLASLGSALIALSVAAVAMFGFEVSYVDGLPVAACLTAVAAVTLAFFAYRLEQPPHYRFVSVPFSMIVSVFAIPVLLIAPFVYLAHLRSRVSRRDRFETVV